MRNPPVRVLAWRNAEAYQHVTRATPFQRRMTKSVPLRAPAQRSTDVEGDHARDRHWYLDKRISLDTIIQIIGMAVVLGGPFILWGRSMEQNATLTAGRVAMIEISVTQREKFDEARAAESKQRQQDMAAKIDKIDEKMNGAMSEFTRQLTSIQISVAQLLNGQPNRSKP